MVRLTRSSDGATTKMICDMQPDCGGNCSTGYGIYSHSMQLNSVEVIFTASNATTIYPDPANPLDFTSDQELWNGMTFPEISLSRI